MQILHWPSDDVWPGPPSAVTIGVFDGLHLGHQEVFRQLKTTAGDRPLGAVTFFPHPKEVLTGQPVPLIFPLEKRLETLAEQGLDFCLVVQFSCQFAGISAAAFWQEFLKDRLKAAHLVIGYDLCIGHKQEAGAARIRQMGEERGVSVVVVPAQSTPHGETIKSTLVRDLLALGDVEKSAEMLGRPFSLEAEVVRDRGLGRQIGFPTANVLTNPYQMLPAQGVYGGLATVGENPLPHPAAINIGTRPTTAGGDKTVVEAHLVNYSGPDFYGERLKVEFLTRIRDEKKFTDIESLQKQIALDVETVQSSLKNANVQ